MERLSKYLSLQHDALYSKTHAVCMYVCIVRTRIDPVVPDSRQFQPSNHRIQIHDHETH